MGKLIVIEGLDGSGKSTQLNLLPDKLKANGIDCRSVSFPNYEDDSSALVKMYLAGQFGSIRNEQILGIFQVGPVHFLFPQGWALAHPEQEAAGLAFFFADHDG